MSTAEDRYFIVNHFVQKEVDNYKKKGKEIENFSQAISNLSNIIGNAEKLSKIEGRVLDAQEELIKSAALAIAISAEIGRIA